MFRSLELNTALKGSKTSSHMKGEAMDITRMACGKENCKSNLRDVSLDKRQFRV